MNHRPLRTCESELTYPCTHHLQAFANNVILIRFTTNSHSGNSFIMHGLSQTLLLFQTFPNFQVNISIVLSPVNCLHINLQVVNFQRWEHTFGSSKEPEPLPSTSGMVKLQLTLSLLLLTVLWLCRPHSLSPLQSVTFLPVRPMPVPVGPLLHCSTTVFFKALYYKIKMFSCLFLCII